MPFTPFHFGPHISAALPLQRYIDVPIFIGANVTIDIEPLVVLVYNLNYPLHGYCHTFIYGIMVGFLLALVVFPFSKIIKKAMLMLRLPYTTNILKMVLSGILGVWMHILFDMPLYQDIKPFYPLSINPLYGIVSENAIYVTCVFLFLPAMAMYFYIVFVKRIKTEATDS
jgi:membrane-bound metal-dependent hydrolase YbcI (DUF457 family)